MHAEDGPAPQRGRAQGDRRSLRGAARPPSGGGPGRAAGASGSPEPVPVKHVAAQGSAAHTELADTGTPSDAPVVAGAGLAVVAAGSAGVWFARRRRTATQG
ncbi:LAETG motif-containing sortase-dependent surface protein [Streptomyces griseorubiginosus]